MKINEIIVEGKPGLWANINSKRKRIKGGSGERMRKPGSKGAPTAQNFKDAASEGVAEGKKSTLDLEFRIRHKDNIINIYTELDGVMVGYAKFNVRDNTLVAGKVSVDPDYRRQGIATAIYDYAKDQGYTIIPSQSQTDLGREFWKDREAKKDMAEDTGDAKFDTMMGNISKQSMKQVRPATSDELRTGYTASKSHAVGADGNVYYFMNPKLKQVGLLRNNQRSVSEGWQEEADEIGEWAEYVRTKLLQTPKQQRWPMARQLSQIEVKNFGSNLIPHKNYDNKTGKPVAGQSYFTEIVQRTLRALTKPEGMTQAGYQSLTLTPQDIDKPDDRGGKDWVVDAPLGWLVVPNAGQAPGRVKRLLWKAYNAGPEIYPLALDIWEETGDFTEQDYKDIIIKASEMRDSGGLEGQAYRQYNQREGVAGKGSQLEETYHDDDQFFEAYGVMEYNDEMINEAEYQGRKVTLNKPFRTSGGPKKFSVYVKNEKGNVVKVNFGDPKSKIKKHIPGRRANFRARHNCDSPGPKTSARYWSCRNW